MRKNTYRFSRLESPGSLLNNFVKNDAISGSLHHTNRLLADGINFLEFKQSTINGGFSHMTHNSSHNLTVIDGFLNHIHQ